MKQRSFNFILSDIFQSTKIMAFALFLVVVAQVHQLLGRPGHFGALVLQRIADAEPPRVDDRTDADRGSIDLHIDSSLTLIISGNADHWL